MNNEMKKHIKDGFDQLAVDVFDDIRNNLEISERTHVEVNRVSAAKKSRYRKRAGRTAAACAAVALAAGIGAYYGTNQNSYAAVICIDANPSIVMEVDSDNQVTRIKAGDDSSREFASELSENLVYPMSVESAVNIAIDELGAEGYISDKNMDTVISYCYKDEPSAEVKDEIDSAASQSMKKGSYTVQDFKETRELEKTAEANYITQGKCYYIETLAADHKLTLESCAGKSIAEIQMEADKEDSAKAEEAKGTAAQTGADNKSPASGTSVTSNSSTGAASSKSQSSKQKEVSGKSSTSGTSSGNTAAQKQQNQKTASSKETASSTASSSQSAAASQEKTAENRPTVVAAVCTSDGYIRVHFSKRVTFASDLKIIVTDSEGQILRSRVVYKKMTFIKLRAYGIKENSTYSVTIAGVKGENAGKYRSVTTTVKAKSLD